MPEKAVKFHIQPYHMNGLNWRLAPDSDLDSIHKLFPDLDTGTTDAQIRAAYQAAAQL